MKKFITILYFQIAVDILGFPIYYSLIGKKLNHFEYLLDQKLIKHHCYEEI